jgi:inosine-uridine nucleoside N-ribohydrolase
MKKIYNDATLSLRLPKSLEVQLNKISEQKSIAVGSLCRMILSEWVQNNAGQVLVQAMKNAKPVAHTSQKPIARKPKTQEEIAYDNYINSLSALEDTKDVEDDWL